MQWAMAETGTCEIFQDPDPDEFWGLAAVAAAPLFGFRGSKKL